jgi:single-stranded-DNA-specific exonuclease
LDKDDFSVEVGDLLNQEIWGQGFPQPLFYGEFEVLQQSLMKDKHLRLQLRPKLSNDQLAPIVQAVWFNRTQDLPQTAQLAFRLVTDRFLSEPRVQLMIEAMNHPS